MKSAKGEFEKAVETEIDRFAELTNLLVSGSHLGLKKVN